jgi:large subunit ribosomal protein L28
VAKCEICGKGVTFGKKYSHSHIRTNRQWKPNVQRVRVLDNSTPKKMYVCTRCLRSGKVQRAL